MFGSLGNFIVKRSWWLLAAGAALMIAGGVYGSGVFAHLSGAGFADPNSESYKAATTINREFGDQQSTLIVLFTPKNGGAVTDPEYRQKATEVLQKVKKDSHVAEITDYYSTGAPTLVSKDGKQTYAVVLLKGDPDAVAKGTKAIRDELKSDYFDIKTGGGAGVNADFNDQIGKDLARAETISFALLAILLVVVFRSLVAAALPLLLGALGVLGAFLIVRLMTHVMDVSQYSINVITLLGLGLAIDYSLFVVSRFREELRLGKEPAAALRRTMETAGRTVFFSGITVILSLLGLLVFPINFLQSMGIGGASAVAVSMLAALTVLPAALVLLGRRINMLSFGSVRAEYKGKTPAKELAAEKRSIWYRIASWSVAHPIWAIALIVVPFMLMSQVFLQAKFATPDYRSLPSAAPSRAVTEALINDFPGNSGRNPIQVVAHYDGDINTDRAAAVALADYIAQIRTMPGVTDVNIANVKDNYALISVLYNSQYDEPLARGVVTKIRALDTPAGLTPQVGGATAELTDLLHSLGHYAPYAGILVAVALFVLLFLMLGSIVVPLQAIFVNVLSLSAAFGVLVWIFQQGHLEGLLGFTSVGSIDATQPVLIFGIAFGLSMDYAVFLLSRVKEEYDHSHQPIEAVKEGVQKTGTIITSAAILLIVVVGAFATSAIPLMKQIGIGLALAIFFDAFIIRMLFVPALMRLFGHYNWWAPAPLRRLADRLGFGEVS